MHIALHHTESHEHLAELSRAASEQRTHPRRERTSASSSDSRRRRRFPRGLRSLRPAF
jgi:hypothetical protein